MSAAATPPSTDAASCIERDAPLCTWFGVGGRADRLARPVSVEQLCALLADEPGPVRVLGDGANLLVDDDGVDGLVVSLDAMRGVRWPASGREPAVFAEAGARLPTFIVEAARRGLGGLEGLAGIPASVGGAVRMNAGGAFGQIADGVRRVFAVDLDGKTHELSREACGFGYRRSALGGVVVTGVEFLLTPADPASLRERLKECMARKKSSQPMAERSAGCAFKNPTVDGERVSAGRLIDEAGCKGLRVGGAEVSGVHANFIVTRDGATARDIIQLMGAVEARVLERAGVRLEREVVVWTRGGES